MSTKKIVETAMADDVSNLIEAFSEHMTETLHSVLEEKKREIASTYFAQRPSLDEEETA